MSVSLSDSRRSNVHSLQLSLGLDLPCNDCLHQLLQGPLGVDALRFGFGRKCIWGLVPRVSLGRLYFAVLDATLTNRVKPGVGVLDILKREVGSVDAWGVTIVGGASGE
jgi:hypothetical protein